MDAHNPTPPEDAATKVKALVDKLTELDHQDTGYSGSVSGASFLPLGRRETHTILFNQPPNASSDTLRSIVRLGAPALPVLLEHLTDSRPTKIVVSHPGGIGGMFIGQDEGEEDKEPEAEGEQKNQFFKEKRYRVRATCLQKRSAHSPAPDQM